MKNRLNILIAFAALLILLGAQFYVVYELFKLKAREFVRDYGNEVYSATEAFQEQKNLNPLKTAYDQMNELASHLIFEIPDFEIETDSVRSKILPLFEKVLKDNDEITPFLKNYLINDRIDSSITTSFVIRDLELIDFTKVYPVFNDSIPAIRQTVNPVNPDAIFIRRFQADQDNFAMKVDFYVDFSNRIQIIVKQMSTILIVLSVTVAVVLIVYILTLRNMMKQKKLSELKSDFISKMTHELKTPLSTIAVASASLSLDQVLANRERSKELSMIINRQNRLLNHMIDQVLDISALERSDFTVNKEPVGIKSFLNEIIEAFKINQSEKNMVIDEEYQITDTFSADLDKFQMTRVLNNLFTNAVKYCTTDPVIHVKVGQRGNLMRIVVSDNGVGIDREDQKDVFTKFFRCSNEMPQKVKGLGLGLYFVKRITEAHGGTVNLESSPGKGSTFTLELPVKNNKNENIAG